MKPSSATSSGTSPRTMHSLSKSLIIICAFAMFATGVAIASDQPAEQTPLEIHIQADNEEYYFDTQQFRADGSVRITYGDVLLTADSVLGNPWTGGIEASGNVSFRDQDRTLTGQNFVYNFKTDKGLATDASASVDKIYFRGDELKSEPTLYTITGSRFTTCDADKPHYYMSARELRIKPGKKLLARDVSIVLLGKRIINVPKYTIGLSEEEKAKSKLPAVGISGKYGVHASYEFDVSHEPRTIGILDARLSTRQVLQGGVMYDRVAGQPVFLNVTHRQPYYAGGRSDIMLSRLPELGIRFSSGAQRATGKREPITLSSIYVDPLRPVSNPGRLNLNGEIGIGKFIEEPHHISSERADARAVAWLDPLSPDSRTIISPGVSAQISHYGNGEEYTALGFRLLLARRFGDGSLASLTYMTHSIHGSTPFEFDEIELSDELAAKVRFPVGSFALEIGRRYDLRAHKFFDTEISVGKVMHCLEPKITWKNRFQEISLSVGLVEL